MLIFAAIFALTLASALLLTWALLPTGRAQKVRESMGRLDSYSVHDFRRLELAQPGKDRVFKPLLRRLSSLGNMLTPQGRLSTLRDRIEQAGRPWNLDLNTVLALKAVLVLAVVEGLLLLGSLRVLPGLWFLGLVVLALPGGYYLPDLMLLRVIAGRKRAINRALPDFLDLLTVTVEAGLGLDSALAKIAEKLEGPLHEEIVITLHHMRIGQSREEALRQFAARCGVKDLDKFIAALIQAQRLGVGLGKILRTQSGTMRVTRRQRIEEAAQKAPVKMLFPLVLCIFPSLFLVILGPAAIRIYEALIR